MLPNQPHTHTRRKCARLARMNGNHFCLAGVFTPSRRITGLLDAAFREEWLVCCLRSPYLHRPNTNGILHSDNSNCGRATCFLTPTGHARTTHRYPFACSHRLHCMWSDDDTKLVRSDVFSLRRSQHGGLKSFRWYLVIKVYR